MGTDFLSVLLTIVATFVTTVLFVARNKSTIDAKRSEAQNKQTDARALQDETLARLAAEQSAQLTIIQNERAILLKEMGEQRGKMGILNAQIDSLRDDLKDLKMQLENEKEKNRVVQAENIRLKADVIALESENQHLKARVSQLESEIKKLTQTNTTITPEQIISRTKYE